MKNTGIIRKVDELGRIVVPKELRNKLKIEEGTSIEIFTKGNEIILKKYNSLYCKSCGNTIEDSDNYCRYCGKEIQK